MRKKCRRLQTQRPYDPAKYRLVRCASIIIGFLIISLAAIAVSFIFYAAIFHFTDYGNFIIPILFVLIPAMLFVLGVGMALGKLHPVLVYVLIPVTLLLTFLPLPDSVNLFGGNFFADYPAALNVVEPPFAIPSSMLTARILYAAIGIVLTLFSVIHFKKPHAD